jgi:hypothetical protein
MRHLVSSELDGNTHHYQYSVHCPGMDANDGVTPLSWAGASSRFSTSPSHLRAHGRMSSAATYLMSALTSPGGVNDWGNVSAVVINIGRVLSNTARLLAPTGT